MNEEIEYAEMLEIPVSTVNVIRKSKKRAQAADAELKEEAVTRANERASVPFAAYSSEFKESDLQTENQKNDEGRYEENEVFAPTFYETASKKSSFSERILKVEFGVVCALCAGIFLTNVWVPNSAINVFFRSLAPTVEEVDARKYTDFTLSSILGEGSDAVMTISPAGVLTFVDEGCVYPTADGAVASVEKTGNGKYTIEIAHSDTFSGVIVGLDYVYYEVGEQVKRNVPVGYSNGESEVQVTMYSEGSLLNCFAVTEDNALSWVAQTE